MTTESTGSYEMVSVAESARLEIKDIYDEHSDDEEKHTKGEVQPHMYKPVAPANAPVRLSWKNLTIRSKKNPDMRPIINDISGTICGGLWAIMGSSGSGKTTFLSCMSHRLDPITMSIEGSFQMNDQNYERHDLKKMSGYVMQDDLLFWHLTVEETIKYTAELRMDRKSTPQEREQRGQYVMTLMGIMPRKDVIVGDTRRKGISGGERKRLCIAMELLTSPKLLFLDEPTSGLDSSTAHSVISIMQGLSSRGECTVITTIHQPQSKIYAMFDNLILMRKGEIAYLGSAGKAILYFESLGYPCPPLTNPADHLIEVIRDNMAGDDMLSNESRSDKYARIKHLDDIKFVPYEADYGGTSSMFNSKEVQPWLKQFSTLFRRAFSAHLRNWETLLMNLFVTIIMSCFISLNVWQDIGSTKSSVSKRQPLLFFCVVHQGILAALQGAYAFPLERAIVLRERAAGTYYVSAYFVSKTFADMVAQIPFPIIFTCFVYPVTGLQMSARHFFTFMGFMILDSLSATSVAVAISCVFVSVELSTVVLGLAFEWVRLFGGWFVNPQQLEDYPEWSFASILAFTQYAFIGVSLNENRGLKLHCTSSELNAAGQCVMPPLVPPEYNPPYTGAQFNEFYGYDQYSIGICFVGLVVYILCCRIIAYLALRLIKI
jgi:ABC-type multidrug transport system ATPase subunit